MKGDVRAPRKMDLRERCRKLILTAESELDEELLAMLYDAIWLRDGGRRRLWEALEKICRKSRPKAPVPVSARGVEGQT